MTILRIEHAVLNYDAWKQAFESDPVGRLQAGVRRYAISRAVDNPNLVMIDLEFDSPHGAEALLTALRDVWGRVEGTIIQSPRAQIIEVVETVEY